MKPTVFDAAKALAVMLYLARAFPEERNLYKVLKAIYRANKGHLGRYGRQIFEESYSAMPYGTVPSYAYDMAKHVRDNVWRAMMPKGVKDRLSVSKDDTIKPLSDPDMSLLSDTDLECLDEAINFFRGMTFEQIKDNSHEDEAYKAAPPNTIIPLDDIVKKTLPDAGPLLEYLKTA